MDAGTVEATYRLRDEMTASAKNIAGELKGLNTLLDKFGVTSLLTAGSVAGAGIALGAMMRSAASAGVHLEDLARKASISVREMSAFKFTLAALGEDVDGFSNSMFMMGKRIELGSRDVQKGLDTLGLKWTEFADLQPEQQMLLLSDRFRALPPEMNKSAVAFQVLGRAGRDMLPALLENMRELHDEGLKNSKWTEESTQKAKEFDVALNKLEYRVKAYATGIGRDLLVQLVDWERKNHGIEDSLNLLYSVASTAFTGIRVAVNAAIDIIRAFKSAWDYLPSFLKDVGSDAVVAAAGIWAVNAAMTALSGSAIVTGLSKVVGWFTMLFRMAAWNGWTGAAMHIKEFFFPMTEFAAKVAASATALTTLGAVVGVEYVSQMMKAIMGGRKMADIQTDIAAVLGRSGSAAARFSEEITVTAGATKEAEVFTGKLTEQQKLLALTNDLATDSHFKLSAGVRQYVTDALKAGKTTDEIIAALAEAKIAGDDAKTVIIQMAKAYEEAQKKAQAANDTFKDQMDIISGRKMKQEFDDLAKQLKALGGGFAVIPTEVDNVNKKLDDFRTNGMKLTPMMEQVRAKFQIMFPKIDKSDDFLKYLPKIDPKYFADIDAGIAKLTTRAEALKALRIAATGLNPDIFVKANNSSPESGVRDAQKAEEEFQKVLRTLDEISSSFERLAQIGGASFGALMQAAGGTVTSLKLAMQSNKEFNGHMGIASALFDKNATGTQKFAAGIASAANLASGAMNIWNATMSSSSKAVNTMQGAMAGAQAGAMFGPWGAAIGAAAGAITGLLRGKPEWAKLAKDLGSSLGFTISDELAKAIIKQSKDLGISKELATVLNLNKIVQEAGGLTSSTFAATLARSVELFDLVKRGGKVGTLAQNELNDAIKMFGDYAIQAGGVFDQQFVNVLKRAIAEKSGLEGVTSVLEKALQQVIDSGGLASAQLLDLIRLVNDSGQASAGMVNQLVGLFKGAASGLNDMLGGLQESDAAAQRKTIQGHIDALKKLSESATGAEKDAIEARIKVLQDSLSTIVGHFTVTQNQADGLGAAIVGVFGNMIASGVSFKDALAAVKPSIDALTDAMKTSGVTGGAAFTFLTDMSRMANDAIQGPLVSSIQGANNALRALHNSGMLNQEMFGAIAATATEAYNKIIENGGNANTALAMMQPTLQTIWRLQQDFGYTVDDATQALIDQGVAAGIVGKNQRSDSEKQIDALNKMVDLMGTLIDYFRRMLGPINDVTDSINKIPKEIPDPFAGWKVPDIGKPGGGGGGEGNPPGFAGGTNGKFVNFGLGTSVRLHGYEKVVTAGEERRQDSSASSAFETRLNAIERLLRDQPRSIGLAVAEAALLAGRGRR